MKDELRRQALVTKNANGCKPEEVPGAWGA